MAWQGKQYKLTKQEGFEEYMKAIGELDISLVDLQIL